MTRIFLFSFMAGLSTLAGCLLALGLSRANNHSFFTALLSIAGGIMSGVVVLELYPHSFQEGGLAAVITGTTLGLALLTSVDLFLSRRLLTDWHPNPFASRDFYRKMGLLMAIGISLHDLPEGMSVAAGYSIAENTGAIIALAIGVHNIPEGMAITVPFLLGGATPPAIIMLVAAVSLITPLGTLAGLGLIGLSRTLIPFLMALAAGAMSYLTGKEIVPSAWQKNPPLTLTGLVAGFLSFLLLSHLGMH